MIKMMTSQIFCQDLLLLYDSVSAPMPKLKYHFPFPTLPNSILKIGSSMAA